VAGEAGLAPASPLLVRALQGETAAAGAPPARAAPAAQPQAPPVPPSGGAARPPTPPEGPSAAAAGLPALGWLKRVPAALRAAVAAALLVVLIVVVTGGDDGPGTTAPAARTVTVTATVPAGASGPQVARATPREPMTASGARFEVAPITAAKWARQIRRRDQRSGYRWVTIAVRARNLTRPSLAVRELGYRLRTGAGVIIGPLVLDIAQATAGVRSGRLATGAQASAHLGFEVPADARRGLTFVFDPGGLDDPTVLVALPDQA
jgi:hypothetical protein